MARYGVWQTRLRSFFGYQTNEGLLRPLETNSTVSELGKLHEEFQETLQLDRLEDLQHFYFWETRTTTLGVSILYLKISFHSTSVAYSLLFISSL
jgi:hypothetical protein